ncbi:MAG: hypothetical protein NVS1B13_08520 [Flavisolibacter sp.]
MSCKRYLYYFPVFFALSCSPAKKTSVPPFEIKLPAAFLPDITIDGRADEWGTVPSDFSPRSTLQISVANSAKSLFILMRIPDLYEQVKLLEGGMEVWVDLGGLKNKNTGIAYPVKGEIADQLERQHPSNNAKAIIRQERLQMLGQLISFNRFGFKEPYNSVQSLRKLTGFNGAINWDDKDVLIYELTIPFMAFTTSVKNGPIAIGFNMHGLDRPKHTRAEASSYNQVGDANGGHRAGGSFGNTDRARQRAANAAYRQKERLYIPEVFWASYTPVGL